MVQPSKPAKHAMDSHRVKLTKCDILQDQIFFIQGLVCYIDTKK